MSSFFHGWRRKAGCVTLVMALVFMGSWLRSLIATDHLEFHFGSNTTDCIDSRNGSLGWERIHEDQVHDAMSFPDWQTWTNTPSDIPDMFEDDVCTKWHLRWCGFGSGIYELQNERHTLRVVPYWSITILLTTISTYLILWPGKRPKKITPPE